MRSESRSPSACSSPDKQWAESPEQARTSEPIAEPIAFSRKLLYRGTSGAFVVAAASAGLGLVVHLVIARILGAQQYGIYALTLSWVSVLLVLALFGQDSSVVKLLPGYAHGGASGKMRGLLRGSSAIVFVSSAIVAIVTAAVVYLLRGRLGQTLTLCLLIGCILLPILAQLKLNGGIHRALKRAASAGLFSSVLRPVLLLLVTVVLWQVLGREITAPFVVGATTLAALIALAASVFFLFRAWPLPARREKPQYEFRSWSVVGMHLFFVSASVIAMNRLDVLVLGAFAPGREVGPYYAALQMAAAVSFGTNAVATICAPLVAERLRMKDRGGLAALTHRAAFLAIALTIPIAAVVASAGYWILGLIGATFVSAYVPLLIILGGRCLVGSVGLVDCVLSVSSLPRYAPFFFGGGAALNLLLNLILIPRFGMVGAAIATATSAISWRLVAVWVVHRRLGVNPTILPFGAH